MAIVNILTIENNIVEQLESIKGVERIFVEPDSDELIADNINEPVISVSNSGYTVNEDEPKSCGNRQIMNSLWTIAVICKKEDYLTKASIIMMDIISTLKGYRAKEWKFPLKVANDVRNFNKPDIDERIAYYPITFSVKVIV